jgi:hypothetical protein
VVDSDTRPFQAVFPSDIDSVDGKHFIVLSYNMDSIGLDVGKYFGLYREEARKNHYLEISQIKMERGDDVFYYSEYKSDDVEAGLFVLNFIGKSGKRLLDITYASSNRDITRKKIIFLDMVRSIELAKGLRFFSPFNFKTVVTELPLDPESHA